MTRFAFEGYILTAPASLPRLVEGRNRMELRTGDKHGKRTSPWTVPVDFRSEAALRRHLAGLDGAVVLPGNRDRVRIAPAGEGVAARAVFRFDEPGERRFAWAYAIATLPEGPADAPPRRAVLEWSGDGAAWTTGAAIAIPNTRLQWDGSMDAETVPAEPVRTLWVRVTSETGVIAIEFTGHMDKPPLPSELRIVHRWMEGAEERVFEAPAGQAVYDVVCGPAPERHTIEMRAPSR